MDCARRRPGTREPRKIVRAREIRYISRWGGQGNPDD
jgi:hypothetical protein